MEKEEKAYRAHVLCLPYPSQGHINPMLQFAKRLVSKGLKATLVTTIFISKSMQAQSNSVGLEKISDGYDDEGFAEADSVEAYLKRLEVVGSQSLAELIKKLDSSGYPVNCIVYDAFLPWALDVAKRFGLVGASFFTQSCSVNSIYYHVHRGLLKVPISGPIVSIPGLPALEHPDMPSFLYVPGSYPAYLELLSNQFSNVEKADFLLVNTFEKLEVEVVEWMAKLFPLRTIGPTLPSMYLDKRIEDDKDYSLNLYKTNNGDCMNWLNRRTMGSVVYVSFGSLATLSIEQMEEVAWGLCGSNSYFLWVVRASEEKKLPSKFLEETSEKGLIVTWSPQLEVLSHAAMGCFVTHCGWNSVLESLSFGIPMVGLPQWTDQLTNAKFVESVWGVGVRARVDEKGITKREEIEVCIREVMEGERGQEIKRNASKWRKLGKEAVDEGGSSDKNIDELVSKIVST